MTEDAAVVPDVLRRWFAGEPVLSEDHGMRRIEVRWRVTRVLHVIEMEFDDGPYQSVVAGETAERRTEAGARALAKRWAQEKGWLTLVQCAPMVWLTDDEVPWAAAPTPPEVAQIGSDAAGEEPS